MALGAGTRVGPYEILLEVGAGGMGIVYRARDTRLERDVAVKVLSPTLSGSAEALHRFELEARAAGALEHPNVVTIHDIGSYEGAPYLVSELLAGKTLRELVAGTPLPVPKVVEWGLQIASGLAAAHEKGIVHRDLKPENLFVTHDGRLKILDFGIAKLLPAARVLPPRHANPQAAPLRTDTGAILGTVGYMAPEQIRGTATDHRSDIFAVGAIFYEMLCGRPAFSGATPFETGYSILTSNPELPLDAPAELAQVIQRCLRKDPGERFQTVREIECALKGLTERAVVQPPLASASMRGLAQDRTVAGPVARVAGSRHRAAMRFALAIAAIAIAAVTAGKLARRPARSITFQQLSFRRGSVATARFDSTGENVVYSAAWDGNPATTFLIQAGRLDSRPLDLPPTRILSVGRNGELLALLEMPPDALPIMRTGTLAKVPATGGAPRELLTNVRTADQAPDTGELVVVRDVGGRSRLESPRGTVLYESAGWLSHVRAAPKRRIGFVEHPIYGDSRGLIMLSEGGAAPRALTPDFASITGLAWGPGNDEVWFTADDSGQSPALHAVRPGGKSRVLVKTPGSLALHDVSRDGRVLLSRESWRHFIRVGSGTADRDLSWLDYSVARDLSADGRKVLFFEAGQAGGVEFHAYVRGTDVSAPVLLGSGYALSLAYDGAWALLASVKDPSQLLVVPTGAGEQRTLKLPISAIADARWFPDGRSVLLTAHENSEGPLRMFVVEAASGKTRLLADGVVSGQELISRPVSPDGKRALVHRADGYFVQPVEGGEATKVAGLLAAQVPIGWLDDRSLLVRQSGVPARISVVQADGRKLRPWRDLRPPDTAGVADISWVYVAADSVGTFAYSYEQILSDLFLVSGID